MTAKQLRAAQRIQHDGRLIHPQAIHGTRTSYAYWQCRCWECTSENSRYISAYRARKDPA